MIAIGAVMTDTDNDTPEPGKKKENRSGTKGKGTRQKRPPAFGQLAAALDGDEQARAELKFEMHPRADRYCQSKYQPEWMLEAILNYGAEGMSIVEICGKIGVSRDTLWRWTHQYSELSDTLKTALMLSQSFWEQNGRRATYGLIPNFNATGYIFQMKNRFPRDWRDVKQNEITGVDGGPIQMETTKIDVRQLSPEKREALKQVLLEVRKDLEGEEEEN